MELTDYLDLFIDYLKEKGRARSTLVAYRKDIEQFFEYLKDKDKTQLQSLDGDVYNNYVKFLKNTTDYSIKTVSRKINSMRTFASFLAEKQLVSEDYSQSIDHPNIENKPPRVLSGLEYKALRDTVKNNLRLYTMIELLLQTGIKIGELSRLRRDDVDLERKELKIAHYQSNEKRTIPLNDTAVEILERYLRRTPADRASEGHLFYTSTGKQLLVRNIRTAINNAFRKTGIKNATVNDLRNTFIAKQLNNGIDLETLARTVGHKKTTTTRRYLEVADERPEKTVNHITTL